MTRLVGCLVAFLMVAGATADVSACIRCRHNPCRYHYVAKYVAPTPVIATTNIILNNLYPSGFPFPQQGSSVYGFQQASYQDSGAFFMDRAVRLEELRTTNAERGYAQFQETGRLQLQLNADAIRQQTNAGLAYAAMEANRGTTNQTLQIRIQDGQMSIVQPPPPQQIQQQQQGPQQLLQAMSCASCHDGRGTKGAPKHIVLDGSVEIDQPTLELSSTAVISGKMPPGGNLTPAQKTVVISSLHSLLSRPRLGNEQPPPELPPNELPPAPMPPADNNFGKPEPEPEPLPMDFK